MASDSELWSLAWSCVTYKVGDACFQNAKVGMRGVLAGMLIGRLDLKKWNIPFKAGELGFDANFLPLLAGRCRNSAEAPGKSAGEKKKCLGIHSATIKYNLHTQLCAVRLTHSGGRGTHCRPVTEPWPQWGSHTHRHTHTDTHSHIRTAWPPITALWLPPASTATLTPSLHPSYTLQCFSRLLLLLPHIYPLPPTSTTPSIPPPPQLPPFSTPLHAPSYSFHSTFFPTVLLAHINI